MAKILIVDDDHDILTVLKANLELHGYEVISASSVKEADDNFSEYSPDLVVLDLILPDGDGIELCRKWRGDHKQMPVIMLTARDMVSDRVLGLESGADDYMIKPFEPIELIARIKACLRRTQADTNEIVEIGHIRIDRGSMIVSLDGNQIELTPKEYQLLNLFVDHEKKVLSREFIKRSLWRDSQVYSWSRVIDVHIQHLRQKIEPDPSNPAYIKTILGAGYKFEIPDKK